MAVEEQAGEEAADEGTDDAEDDVADDSEALVTLDEEPRELPGDCAKHDPRDDVHEVCLHPLTGFELPGGPGAM